jgi:hypothetical protein
MRVIVTVGLVAMLAACQTASYQRDENSPYYVVPVGSQLILTRELQMNPDQVSVYIQYGKLLSYPAIQKYEPFCKFELFHRIESARTVAPDEISVIKAIQHQSYERFAEAGAWQFLPLSARQFAQVGMPGQGGPSIKSFTVRMDLRSAKQPEIFRMTCGRWSAYSSYENLSIAEIRSTLKPLFTLRLPDNR